jgi:photosystem II stability/assembly factor-like uncharacterized protein
LSRSLLFFAVGCVACAAQPTLPPGLADAFPYRNLGPFRAGAWVVDVAVPESPHKAHERTFYVAARTGGVWKTVNAGTTFENVTDSQGINSVGAVALAPSNPDIVWVGSGDNTITRSAYYGNGVYRSTDGGKTWRNMGLADTQHIARIVIDPANPDVVWVAALGHLFSRNTERGIFKTADGGRTWKRTLFVNERTGAVDLAIDRRNPNVLYAAMYDAMRYPWKLEDGGQGSGIFKSTDGGSTWKKLAAGFPAGKLGRIGLDICRSRPDVLYAVVDNFNPGANQRPIGGEVYRSDDAGVSWRKVSADSDDVSRKAGYSFNQLRVDPNDPEKVYITGSNMIASSDGGKTWAGLNRAGGNDRPFRRAFGDFRSLWIDPEDSDRMIAASDGGVFVSYDGGRTCDSFINLQLGEVYAIGVDNAEPYNLYAGLQDHENWKGPVDGWSGAVGLEDWATTGIGDGMYNAPDPNGRWLYNTQEFGHLARVDQQNRTRAIVEPPRPANGPFLRFNWTAPVVLSPHDNSIIYYGAQVLFRSKDRGDHWETISPDLTTNDAAKITPAGGSIQHCTIVTIAESPARAGVIWVGTDDGMVQVTLDGGVHWTDTTGPLVSAGAPADAWVTRVFPSRFDAATAYITKSRRRADDYRPFVFRTTDSGATWTNLSAGLTSGVNAIAEDTANRNLLFCGTDTGVFVSFDRGSHWTPFRNNMPVVPVSDLIVHPREGDLIVGTFGRGLWVANFVPLRGMAGDQSSTDSVLLPVRSVAQRHEGAWGNYRLYGDRYPMTSNEPNGMVIAYVLKNAASVSLAISDAEGHVIRKIAGQGKAGINRLVWNLEDDRGAPVAPGEFTIALGESTQKARLISRAPEDSPRRRAFREQ